MTQGPSDADRLRVLRDALTATGAGIYLCTHLAGPVPTEVMAAVHESDELELRIGRVGPDRSDDLDQREKEARAVVAATIKATPERIVLTHGAPEAVTAVTLEILARFSESAPGEAARVIVIEGVSVPVVAAVRAVAAACGAHVEVLETLPRIIPAEVAMLLMAHVDADGHVADLAQATRAVRQVEARLVVDASLSIGALPIEVAASGADALIADTNRWLLGPDSMTLLWLSPTLGEDVALRLRAAVGPFGRGALLALARSLGWLLMYVDLTWVLARTTALAQRMRAALGHIDGLELSTAAQGSGAMLSFRIAHWDAPQAAEELSRSVFAIVDADAERDLLRISVGAWNREDELDRFTARVAELAAETPETLPRRPSLTVLSRVDTELDQA